MATDVQICNLALQLLGASQIKSLDDGSRNANACSLVYDHVLNGELRSHPWNFAIKRFQLAASATPPAFGYSNAFQLPEGWLKLLPPDPSMNFNDRDWIIESGQVLTDWEAPLNVRCVMKISDPNQMDELFHDVFVAALACELCESLTQSNTKKAAAKDAYKEAIKEARKANAIEKVPAVSVEDSWITSRA